MPKLRKQFTNLKNSNIIVKTYTFLTISVVLLIVLLVFAIRPTILTIFDLNEKSKQLTVTLDALIQKNKKLSSIKTQLDNGTPVGIKEAVDFVKAEVIPETDDSLYMASNMDQIANDTGVVLTSFSPSDVTDKKDDNAKTVIPKDMKSKKISLSFDSRNLSDINTFISRLQQFARVNKINNVSVTQNTNKTNQNYKYSTSIDFLIFYKPINN